MIVKQGGFLKGHITGLGVIHADGSEEFKFLDKPIGNRIVSDGLDNLFTINGRNDYYCSGEHADGYAFQYLFGKGPGTYSTNNNSRAYGATHYMAYGTDATATSFTDSALRAQHGGYSESYRGYYNGTYYCGTKLVNSSTLKLRQTFIGVAATDNISMREVGFFGRNFGTDVYPMFARVVLDQPFALSTGDQPIVMYELTITIDDSAHNITFNDVLDADGNVLKGVYGTIVGTDGVGSNWYIGNCCMPCISEDNYGKCATSTSASGTTYTTWPGFGPMFAVPRYYWLYGSILNNPMLEFGIFSDSRKTAYLKYAPNMQTLQPTAIIKNYVPGTFYRDMVCTYNSSFPGLTEHGQYVDISQVNLYGTVLNFGSYDSNDTWQPQVFRKYFGDVVNFTIRQQWSTADTV